MALSPCPLEMSEPVMGDFNHSTHSMQKEKNLTVRNKKVGIKNEGYSFPIRSFLDLEIGGTCVCV